jgi:hypothetical protein
VQSEKKRVSLAPGSLDNKKNAEEDVTFCLIEDGPFFPLFFVNDSGIGLALVIEISVYPEADTLGMGTRVSNLHRLHADPDPALI